ncbi:glycosyl transferase [Polaribacter pacificus]|uniref:Glycosyl transferase n=1 Tax=Polaribacter pacificus TaxID=1775173 RepID=A0A917MCR4_9FLAO|nr:glycosyltransferase [Polaribacter pacificus]GGG93665.1 glycosyl transferase [Polaribacter pacificus]
MKILHIVEDFSLESGGVRTVVKALNSELISNGYDSLILSEKKEKEDDVVVVKGRDLPWKYSKNWSRTLLDIHKSKPIDCIHIHGVWMYPQFIASKFAIEHKIPFVLSPHGMYEPWLWKQGGLKKKLYFNLLAKKKFSKSAVLHAITKSEKENLQHLFADSTVQEIPNLIKTRQVGFEDKLEKKTSEKYLLFIGRLDPIKGIDVFIKAFSQLSSNEFTLKIAGAFNSYKNELESYVKECNLDKGKVEFLGFVKEKTVLIENAFIVVTPSHSEVIGMVNLEAAILKTPVISTHQTGLDPGWNSNGGMLVNPTVSEVTAALKTALSWTVLERNEYGNTLSDFVTKKYSWEHRLLDWVHLYENLKDG